MLLSPLAIAVKHAPNLQFDSQCEPERKKELGLRALAFMEPKERDAIVLQAGMILSAWKPKEISLVPPDELEADTDLIKETFLRHKPSKFRELQPVVRELSKKALRNSEIETNLYANPIPVATTSTVNTFFNAFNTAPTTLVNLNTAGNMNTMVTAPNGTWNVYTTMVNGAATATWTQTEATHNARLVNAVENDRFNTEMAVMVNQYIATSQVYYSTTRGHDSGAWGEARRLARYEQERQEVPSKAERKVIRRQIDLLGAVLDKPGDVQVFLRGESLTVMSDTTGLKYRFTRNGALSVANMTTGGYTVPYKLEVLTSDDVYLTKMCVYLKETPMLDQLAAMMLYIKSGEDMSLLETANYFSIGDHDRLNVELTRLGLLKKKVKAPVWFDQRPHEPAVVDDLSITVRATGEWVEDYQWDVDLSTDAPNPTTELVTEQLDNQLAANAAQVQYTTAMTGITYEAERYDDVLVEEEVAMFERGDSPRLLNSALETIHMTPPRKSVTTPTAVITDFPNVVAVREMFKDYYMLKLFNPS